MYDHKRSVGIPTSLVSAGPATRHVQALVQLGWSCGTLADLTHNELSIHTFHNLNNSKYRTIERRTAATVIQIPHTLNVPTWLNDTSEVPPLGATRRIQALTALGWTRDQLQQQIAPGVSLNHVARGLYDSMHAHRWHAIDELYQRLCMTPGPSTIGATRAAARGYHPPLAWDDIDCPDETPRNHAYARGTGVDVVKVRRILDGVVEPTTKAEKIAATKAWMAAGRSLGSLERLTGWNVARYTPARAELEAAS
jgi:hypothetical protein